jgi:hypothetical protein
MTKWNVSIASDPDGEGVKSEQIFDNVNDAKAYIFDLISLFSGASTIYVKYKFYEEFKVTAPSETFYIYIFGFPG